MALPDDPAKPAMLGATHDVVLFSIVVQGSTLSLLAGRMPDAEDRPEQS
jgi:NhaP-type Na+/H+ or K+/H+ antiporter